MQDTYRVYIAAAATPDETARAQRLGATLTAAGVEVVSTWCINVAAVGDSNPRGASVEDRRQWSMTDLAELATAHALWLLCPPPGVTSRGAWVELGFAHARSALIVSSGDTRQSIFTALGVEYDADEEALNGILLVADRHCRSAS